MHTAKTHQTVKTPRQMPRMLSGQDHDASQEATAYADNGAQANILHSFDRIPVFSAPHARIQPKLMINEPGDQYEQEADRMAEKVMRMHEHAPPLNPSGDLPDDSIQRKCAACEAEAKEDEDEENTLMRKADAGGGFQASPALVAQLNAAKGDGFTLPEGTKNSMERTFGADFSGVRIHTDAEAAQMSRGIQARAFTQGNDIYFNRGEYDTESGRGRRLLAHELTHVLQQNSGRINRAIIQRDGEEGEGSTGSWAADMAIERISEMLASTMRRTLPIAIPEPILNALIGAQISFLVRSYERLITQGGAVQIIGRITELRDPSILFSFCSQYIWGVLKGLFSPITGLVQLGIMGFEFQQASIRWIIEHAAHIPGLINEAQGLATSFQEFTSRARTTLEGMRERGQLLEFAGAVFAAASSAQQSLERQMARMARQKGREAADSLANYFLRTPLPRLAELVGEIVGTVVIELVLLLFTEGIGNLITKISQFARTIRGLSRGAVVFLEVSAQIGRIITQIEHIIGAVLSRTVLRPLMPLFEALEPLLGRMRQFAQRLTGIGREAGTDLARASASASRAAGAAEQGTTAAARPQLRVIEGGGATTPPRRPALRDVSAPRQLDTPQPVRARQTIPEEAPQAEAVGEELRLASGDRPRGPVASSRRTGGSGEPPPIQPSRPTRASATTTSASSGSGGRGRGTGQQAQSTRSGSRPGRTRPPLSAQEQLNAGQRLQQARAQRAELFQDIQRETQTASRAREQLRSLFDQPPPTPLRLRQEISRINRMASLEERLAVLDEIERTATGLTDADRAYLQWRRQTWNLSDQVRQAEQTAAELQGRIGNAESAVERAAAELRTASRDILATMRSSGPNYRAKASINFDEVMPRDAWDAIPNPRPRLATDHLVSLDRISQMQELDPLLAIYQRSSPTVRSQIRAELEALGDISENLVRMRESANLSKGARSWNDITYSNAQRYGYTPADVDRMRILEQGVEQLIKNRISGLIERFENIAGRTTP